MRTWLSGIAKTGDPEDKLTGNDNVVQLPEKKQTLDELEREIWALSNEVMQLKVAMDQSAIAANKKIETLVRKQAQVIERLKESGILGEVPNQVFSIEVVTSPRKS